MVDGRYSGGFSLAAGDSDDITLELREENGDVSLYPFCLGQVGRSKGNSRVLDYDVGILKVGHLVLFKHIPDIEIREHIHGRLQNLGRSQVCDCNLCPFGSKELGSSHATSVESQSHYGDFLAGVVFHLPLPK